MDAAGLNDLFIVTLARELHDGERVFVGANQADVALAAYLARQLWAPRLKVWAAATAQLDRGLDPLMVGRSGNDNLVVQLRGASFPQARAFEDVRGPVVFAGGLQVDARGNANLAGIRDASGGWTLRGRRASTSRSPATIRARCSSAAARSRFSATPRLARWSASDPKRWSR
jgi:glutaconate CoA-transferase subunit B